MSWVSRIIVGAVVVAVVAGASFYGGMVYGKNQAEAAQPVTIARQDAPFEQAPQGMFQRGAGQGGGMLVGQIEETGEGKLLITDSSGKQTWVYVTETTLIEKNMSVAVADLSVGETVIVSGSLGSDGSITARSVQVSPAGRFAGTTPVPARRP